jgi:hypothetical protein
VLAGSPALSQDPQERQEPARPALESKPVTTPQQREADERHVQGSQDQTEKLLPAIERILPALENLKSAIRSLVPKKDQDEDERKKSREIEDLNAQKDMALWAKAMFWATVAAVIITGLGLILIWRTLIHTRRATKYAGVMARDAKKANALHEKAAHHAQRAWLKVDAELLDNLQFDEGGTASFRIKFTADNIGKSPAFAVAVHAEIYLHAPDWPSPAVKQRKFADTIREIHENTSGSIVFPGSDWKHTPVLKIWADDARAARDQVRAANGIDEGYLYPFIIGCIQYLTSPDEKPPRQTGFIYAIRIRNEGRPPNWLPDGMSFDRKQVALEERSIDPNAVT